MHLPISAIIAEILYIGIISDTNRFHYPVVNSTTFEILAFLTSYHLNLSKIYDQYYEQTIATLQLKALILTNYVLSDKKLLLVCYHHYY